MHMLRKKDCHQMAWNGVDMRGSALLHCALREPDSVVILNINWAVPVIFRRVICGLSNSTDSCRRGLQRPESLWRRGRSVAHAGPTGHRREFRLRRRRVPLLVSLSDVSKLARRSAARGGAASGGALRLPRRLDIGHAVPARGV